MIRFGAIFSPCRRWRYTLSRWWDTDRDALNVIALNPSVADENRDDPTVRRCVRFAMRHGYGGLVVTNIFAFRATYPADMRRARDPVGPDNDRHLREQADRARTVVVAWGTHGQFLGRGEAVLRLLEGIDLFCWRETANGFPGHPLYLPGNSPLMLYRPAVPVVGRLLALPDAPVHLMLYCPICTATSTPSATELGGAPS